MFLIIWDKLFGTFQPELTESEYEPIRYGLTKPLARENAATIVFHEWHAIWEDMARKDIGYKEKFGYLFGPPGWSHDGTRRTSEEIHQLESGSPAMHSYQPEKQGPASSLATNRDRNFR